MKKLMIAFSFMLFVGSLAAANNMEQPILKVVTVESKEQEKGKFTEAVATNDVCTICVFWKGGGACGSGEDCKEALECLLMN